MADPEQALGGVEFQGTPKYLKSSRFHLLMAQQVIKSKPLKIKVALPSCYSEEYVDSVPVLDALGA